MAVMKRDTRCRETWNSNIQVFVHVDSDLITQVNQHIQINYLTLSILINELHYLELN